MAKVKRQLSNWLDSYLEYVDNTEPAVMFHRWTSLSLIASVLQRKARLDWGTLTFYPNIFVVLVSPSGRARKSTAMDLGEDILRTVEGINFAANSTTRAALVQCLARCTTEITDKLSGKSEKHASLTVYSGELSVFLGSQEMQMMSDLIDWYDCKDPWDNQTKHSGVDYIHGTWVNLLGATTPRLLQEYLQQAIGTGLSSRIIWVYESKKGKVIPFPGLTKEAKALKEKLIHDLDMISKLSGSFKVSQDFWDLWEPWYLEQEANPPFNDPNFDGYISRRAAHALKLCQLVCAARTESMVISKSDLEYSINLLSATEAKMSLAFGGSAGQNYTQMLTSVMKVIYSYQKISKVELMQKLVYDIDTHMMDKILKSLEAAKYISLEPKENDTIISHIPTES